MGSRAPVRVVRVGRTTDRTLVDSDIMLDPMYVRHPTDGRRPSVMNGDTAIGLAHSNVEGTLMYGSAGLDVHQRHQPDRRRRAIGCQLDFMADRGAEAGNVGRCPELNRLRQALGGGALRPKPGHSDQQRHAALDDFRSPDGQPVISRRQERMHARRSRSPPGSKVALRRAGTPRERCDRSDEVRSINPKGLPDPAGCHRRRGAAIAGKNFEGSWWTAPAGSESGWGLNFAHQGGHNLRNLLPPMLPARPGLGENCPPIAIANKSIRARSTRPRGGLSMRCRSIPSRGPYREVATRYAELSDANDGTFAYSVNESASDQNPSPERQFSETAGLNVRDAIGTGDRDQHRISGGPARPPANPVGGPTSSPGRHIFALVHLFDFDGHAVVAVGDRAKIAPAFTAGKKLCTDDGTRGGAVPFDSSQGKLSTVGHCHTGLRQRRTVRRSRIRDPCVIRRQS